MEPIKSLALYQGNASGVLDSGDSAETIAANTDLNYLYLNGFNENDLDQRTIDRFRSYFQVISGNESIQSIKAYGSVLSGGILETFRLPGIQNIEIDSCLVTPQAIDAIRSLPSSLQIIIVFGCEFQDKSGNRSSEYLQREFIKSISCFRQLRSLSLRANKFSSDMFDELQDFFSDGNNQLRQLELQDDSVSDILHQLSINGLASSRALEILSVYKGELSLKGCDALSSILSSPSTTLSELDMSSCHICDEGAKIFAKGLFKNSTIEILNLSHIQDLTEVGWLELLSALNSPSSVVQKLDLHWNPNITDNVIACMSDILARNQNLESVNLGQCESVTGAGWAALGQMFLSPVSNLRSLSLYQNNINDDAVISFANGLMNNSKLEYLCFNDPVCELTILGWRAISELLQSSRSGLRELNMSRAGFNDEAAVALANALVENTKLETLTVSIGYLDEEGLSAFSNLLCNTSSIEATMGSNHTLQDLGVGADRIPSLSEYLMMNEEDDKLQVARRKVFMHHRTIEHMLNSFVIDE